MKVNHHHFKPNSKFTFSKKNHPQQGSLYYQPKQRITIREIPQNHHKFVLFDSPKMGNLITPPPKHWSEYFCVERFIHKQVLRIQKGTGKFLQKASSGPMTGKPSPVGLLYLVLTPWKFNIAMLGTISSIRVDFPLPC